jgi:hypothetical protein
MNSISFNNVLIPTIIDDSKTMSRRIIKQQPTLVNGWWEWPIIGENVTKGTYIGWRDGYTLIGQLFPHCPYGQIGDLLKVKGHDITLKLTDIRVERVRDISEIEAEKEGVDFLRHIPDCDETLTAKELFMCLFESIYGPNTWDKNPWVWVLTFKRLEAILKEGGTNSAG